MSLQNLAIGILAITTKQREALEALITSGGLTAAATVVLNQGETPQDKLVDVWVANLEGIEEHNRYDDVLGDFPQLDVPVIYYDNAQLEQDHGVTVDELDLSKDDTQVLKSKRFISKLRAIVSPVVVEPKLGTKPRARAKQVWVLAASTGGPDAIAKFLHGLPDEVPGVALIYVQHIEANALTTLKRVVNRNCKWDTEFVDAAHVIKESTIYIVSPAHQIDILENGRIAPLDEDWKGFYKPSVNQVAAKVARVYKDRSGMIVFSGMGDDGKSCSQLFHHRGGQIWAQDNATCTIDSMPDSVAKTGTVSFVGDPAALALAFVNYHGGKPIEPYVEICAAKQNPTNP